jgi:hypothetical protein
MPVPGVQIYFEIRRGIEFVDPVEFMLNKSKKQEKVK